MEITQFVTVENFENSQIQGKLLLMDSSVSVSAQDCSVVLRKAHTHSALSDSSLPKVAFKIVRIFVWLNTDRSQP